MEAVQYAGGIVAALNGGRVEACTTRDKEIIMDKLFGNDLAIVAT